MTEPTGRRTFSVETAVHDLIDVAQERPPLCRRTITSDRQLMVGGNLTLVRNNVERQDTRRTLRSVTATSVHGEYR
jgi:hypothetical protein